VLQFLGRCLPMRLFRWKWVDWGHERGAVSSVSPSCLFLKQGSSRREESSLIVGTSNPWGGSPTYFVRRIMGASLLVRGRDSFKKSSSHHLKSPIEGGGAIPRCRCGGCGHGGGRSKSLALVETSLEPTDSSVKLVLT